MAEEVVLFAAGCMHETILILAATRRTNLTFVAAQDGAMNTVIVKSKIDNRYSADEIVTHDGCRRVIHVASVTAA